MYEFKDIHLIFITYIFHKDTWILFSVVVVIHIYYVFLP